MPSQSHLSALFVVLLLAFYVLLMEGYSYVIKFRFAPVFRHH